MWYYVFVPNGKYGRYGKLPQGIFSLPYLFTFYKFFHNSPSNSSPTAAVHIFREIMISQKVNSPVSDPVAYAHDRQVFFYLYKKILSCDKKEDNFNRKNEYTLEQSGQNGLGCKRDSTEPEK